MAAKTLHVYHSADGWTVKKEGQSAATFRTKREAVAAAKSRIKGAASGQLVVHAKDGRITEYRAYGMPAVQDHPKQSPLRSRRIAQAVHAVVLARLNSDRLSPRAGASAK